MVEVASGAVAGDKGIGLVDELVCHIGNCLRGATEEIRGVDPSHRENKFNAKEYVRVGSQDRDDVGEGAEI